MFSHQKRRTNYLFYFLRTICHPHGIYMHTIPVICGLCLFFNEYPARPSHTYNVYNYMNEQTENFERFMFIWKLKSLQGSMHISSPYTNT